MFRKPSTASIVHPASGSASLLPSLSALPLPSTKKQKITHTPALTTPSRPRPRRQTQLSSFVSTPASSSSNNSSAAAKNAPPAAAGPVRSGGKRPRRNGSITSFFRPLSGSTLAQRSRHGGGHDDGLFTAHGGYGLDVSDPEDCGSQDGDEPGLWVCTAADEEGESEVGLVGAGAGDSIGQLQLVARDAPPQKDLPALNLSGLRLNNSASMLFKKTPSSPPATTSPTPVTATGAATGADAAVSSCGSSDDERVRQAAAKHPQRGHASSLKRGLLWKRDPAVVDEIEDASQHSQRRAKRVCPAEVEADDEIQSTCEPMAPANDTPAPTPASIPVLSVGDDAGDGEDGFGFDPASRVVEDGFDDWDRDAVRVVMRPADSSDGDGGRVEAAQTTVNSDSLICCPVCGSSLADLMEANANSHVNRCLDGPTPRPQSGSTTAAATAITTAAATITTTALATTTTTTTTTATATATTAFTKLMTSNSEAHAWAAAAAKAEAPAKGGRARRSCPFYKILFDGPITVDAFRYGAVPGCSAYFLSHFHSDHYVGLTDCWDHGPIYCSAVTARLVRSQLGVDPRWLRELPWEQWVAIPGTGGVRVRGLDANHCPGSMMFLFEKPGSGGKLDRILHCGDFRAEASHLRHPLLRAQRLDTVYLDTTYLDPKYAFPSQASVIAACADKCVALRQHPAKPAGGLKHSLPTADVKGGSGGRLLVVVGTYSIGKERLCTAIARALHTKIYAPPSKLATLRELDDPELAALLTADPAAAQVHMVALAAIASGGLTAYLAAHPSFVRIVAFRPSGWSYRPSPPPPRPPPRSAADTRRSRVPDAILGDVLYSPAWRSEYTAAQMAPMRGSSSSRVAIYAVPYSEHSSFRELCMFCVALDIGRVVPTVNVGKAETRERMGHWITAWERERARAAGGRDRFALVEHGGRGVW